MVSLNSELTKVSRWFKANVLTITVKQTDFMVFH